MKKEHRPKWFERAKVCKECGQEFNPQCWQGKDRWRCETEARYHKKQFCNNDCRSAHLSKEKNYFTGKHLTPHNKGKRKDMWRVRGDRYIKIFYKDGTWEYEHRKVAREQFGDIDGLVVHHINLNGHDNNINNLEVMTASNHKKLHHQLT